MSQLPGPPERSPEERILDATVKCIELHGIEAVTTRRIAEIAGVNSAAINYYFRSKQNLLHRTLSASVESMFGDWERIIADDTIPLDARLRPILAEALEGSRAYPNLVKAHVHAPLMENNYETEFARRFRRFIVQARDCAAPYFGGLSKGQVEYRIVALLSGAILIGLMPGLFGDLLPSFLADAEGRSAYVDLLIRQFMPEGEKS